MTQADERATFAIDLEDGTSGTAETAATALKKLREGLDADTKALAAMQKAMKNLQLGGVVNVAQFRDLKAKIDAKKEAIAGAQSAYLHLGGRLGDVGKRARPVVSSFDDIAKGAKAVPGPLGNVVGSLDSLKGLLAGGGIALGIAAIAAALVVLVAAAGAAAVALFKYGVAQANARRSELLRLEGMTKMRSMWGFAAGNAREMQAAIDSVSASSALGRDKVADYSAQLYQAGLRGANLTAALEAASMKASVQGDAAAAAFVGWAAGANMAGQSVTALSDRVKNTLGRVAQAQMLDLDVQAAKLRESFGALFADLKIEGLLKAVSGITQLFSQSTRSGQALKAIITTLFKPMIAAVEFIGPLIKRFFQGIIIGALLVGIGILTLRKWFRKTFGDSETLKGIDLTWVAIKAGIVAVGVITAGFLALAAVVALVLSPFIAFYAYLKLIPKAAEKIASVFGSIKWGELGTSIIDGIVGGIKGAAGVAVDAIGNVADAMWSKFRDTLGIASPSKAFVRLGLAIPQGVQTGVDKGTPDAQKAVARMVEMPTVAPVASHQPQAPRPASAPSVTVTVGDLNVTSTGTNASEIVADIRTEFTRMLEGIAIQLGADTAGA